MSKPLTIGALAKRANVPASTVRYYERTGLLQPAGRTDSNYRVYNEDAIERLQFVASAKNAGFTLDDISNLLAIRDGHSSPCSEVQALVETRLDDVKLKLDTLRDAEKVLKRFLALCSASDDDDCEALNRLSSK